MSIYPNYLAGQRLTAARLAASQPLVAQKASSTDRANVTAFADDPELVLQLAASAVYVIEFYIGYSAPSAGLFKTSWTVPLGASGNRTASGPGSAATDSNADNIAMRSGVHGFTTAVTYGSRGNTGFQAFAFETALVTSGAGGKCALAWAQATANATSTRVAVGSWARALRIS